MATEKEIRELTEAMWQLLDDMSDGGQSVCLAAKAQARIAFEAFRGDDNPECEGWMTLDEAKAVIKESDGR